MQSETSRATAYDCDFAFEAEDVGEVLELDVRLCGAHLVRRCMRHRDVKTVKQEHVIVPVMETSVMPRVLTTLERDGCLGRGTNAIRAGRVG